MRSMNEFREDELFRRFQQLAAVQPSPEATKQALDRVRGALTLAPTTAAGLGKLLTYKSLGAASVALLVVGGLLTWALPAILPGANDTPAFNAVLKPLGSVSYRQTTSTDDSPSVTMRLWI